MILDCFIVWLYMDGRSYLTGGRGLHPVHKAIRDMHTLFTSKERAYWETKVAADASNSKKRWQILNKLMCNDVKNQIPDSATAEALSKFFSLKVESVRSATENAAPPSFSPCPKPCCFDTFQPLTPEQVLILIERAPDKTSDLNPVLCLACS